MLGVGRVQLQLTGLVEIDRAWLDKPKPAVAPLEFGKAPPEKLAMTNDDGTCMRNYLKLMFDVIALALRSLAE